MKEGKQVQKPWLPENYGYIKYWDKVFRGFKQWHTTGVKPTEADIDDADPIWEADLLTAWAGYNYLEAISGAEDAPPSGEQDGSQS